MQKAILGKKIGMTQIFTEDGLVIPVTVIEAGPVSVVQKTMAMMPFRLVLQMQRTRL